MTKLKVINLYGGPGIGKSTTAAGLFNLMSIRGHSVEFVSEYAKDLTWARNWGALSHQPSILAEQDYRLRRLDGQVEWVITDSPLPLQIAYMGDHWKSAGLEDLAWGLFDDYRNFNVLLQRNSLLQYREAGHNQSHTEACILDNVVDNLFGEAIESAEDYALELTVDQQSPYAIYNWLTEGGHHGGTNR